MKTAVLMLVMLTSLMTVAQEPNQEVARTYDTQLIHPYSNSRWMRDGKILKKRQLRQLLRDHSASAAAYKIYRNHNRIANTLYFVGFGAIAASMIIAPEDEDVPIWPLAGIMVPTLGSIPFAIKADRSLHKAVRLYNRAVLTGDSARVVPGK
jgi:hypothetical protein